VDWDAAGFWHEETVLRAPLGLPPLRWAIRIESTDQSLLGRIHRRLAPGDAVIGPLPLERGRSAVLVLCGDRSATLAALRPLRDEISRSGGDMRLDVDPVDLG
jgi:hypothetical protein